MELLPGNATGSSDSRMTLTSGAVTYFRSLPAWDFGTYFGDLDEDGKSDLVFFFGDTVVVYKNTSLPGNVAGGLVGFIASAAVRRRVYALRKIKC